MTVDLHLHSLVSDGTASPEEVVRRAAAVGLRVVAVADHDDVGGVEAARRAAAEHGVVLVPALELTARVDERPEGAVHVLGYGIDPRHPALLDVARESRLGKRRQIVEMLEKLRRLGIPIEDHEVGLDRASDAYVGRNRIASALVVRGLAKDRLRAFRRYLNPGARGWAAPTVVDAARAIAAIKAAGGLAVLAHPTEDDLDRRVGKLCDAGLDGIEVFRPKLQGRLLERAERARVKHGLIATGGSDWHGLYPTVPLGDWKVTVEQVRPLLERLGVEPPLPPR